MYSYVMIVHLWFFLIHKLFNKIAINRNRNLTLILWKYEYTIKITIIIFLTI